MDRAPNIDSTPPKPPAPVVDLDHARKAYACRAIDEKPGDHDAALWADCAVKELVLEVQAWRDQGGARTAQQAANLRRLVAAAQDAVNALAVLGPRAHHEGQESERVSANLINLKRALEPFRDVLLAVLVAVGAVIQAGCGSGVVGPGPVRQEAPQSVQAADGVTGAAVEAAVAPAGAGVSVQAAGYLPRVQVAAPTVWLWPQAESYVRGLVYGPHSPGARLARWRRAFVLPPVDGVDVDDLAREIAGVVGLDVGVGPAGAVQVVVDADDPAWEKYPAAVAVAYRDFDWYEVTACRLVFRYGVRPATFAHEVGHCLGLGHSDTAGDLMTPGGGAAPHFSAGEVVALSMMYRRREPGNAAPDVQAGVTSAGARGYRIAVVD